MQQDTKKEKRLDIHQYHSNPILVKYTLEEADNENVNLLREKAGINITYNEKHELTISTWDYVGVVEFSNFILNVTPSFETITDIGRLYKFVNNINIIQPPGTVKFTDEYNHPLEQLVKAFVDECNIIFTTGLYKSYEVKDESISMLKGKLLLKQQMINQSRFNLKFHCEFDEFTSNNLENIIVLDCLKTCQRITKDEQVQKDILNLINHMSVEIESRFVDVREFTKLKYTRLNQNYKNAHVIAKSIIQQRGLMNWNYARTSFTPPLFIKTWELFEKFVRKLFYENFPTLLIDEDSPDPIPTWNIIDSKGKDVETKTMIPDIQGYKKSDVKKQNVVFVADAKMKQDPKIGDSYQMSFYLQKYGLNKGYFLLPQENKMGNVIEMGNTWNSKIYETDLQGVTIQEVLFDVDGILDMISNGREYEIEQILLELITP
jgi:hypothetical protein